MRLALGRLLPQPEEALIDGRGLPDQVVKNKGIIDGDDTIHAISAASIIAKVSRDRIMRNYDLIVPEYGFAKHKGYGTAEHLFNLRNHLACPIHRKGFRPVVNYMPSLSHLKENRLFEKWGKRLAARELIRKGYIVLKMDYRATPYGKIDVVAKENDTIVFVEVKSVSQKTLGGPEEQMNDSKLAKLFNAMNIYLSKNDSVADSRFDLMTVRFGKERPKVKHYKNCLD
jgi:Holliday junction resolvase-like predicted endonuclease